LARAYEVPVLLSQDAFFHRPGVKDLSDLLQAIRLNCTMNEALPHLFVNSERTLHPLVDVERFYGALPCYEAALKNSARLAEGFNFDLSELRYHYPKNMIPAGFSSQSYLEKLVWEGA